MVRVNYEAFEEHYASIRQAACGRQACSVLILVALEVNDKQQMIFEKCSFSNMI